MMKHGSLYCLTPHILVVSFIVHILIYNVMQRCLVLASQKLHKVPEGFKQVGKIYESVGELWLSFMV